MINHDFIGRPLLELPRTYFLQYLGFLIRWALFLQAFLPFDRHFFLFTVISSLFTQNKGRRATRVPPVGRPFKMTSFRFSKVSLFLFGFSRGTCKLNDLYMFFTAIGSWAPIIVWDYMIGTSTKGNLPLANTKLWSRGYFLSNTNTFNLPLMDTSPKRSQTAIWGSQRLR